MIKKILCAVLLFSLYACSKSDDPTIEKEKVIERVLICNEKPVLSKSEEIFIGIRYFKNYSEADKISLTMNGVQGTVQGSRVHEFEGKNHLFKFPAVASAGDFELVLTIENDQNSFTQKKTIRILENYNIEPVWDSFENSYLLKSFPLMVSGKSKQFQPILDLSLGFVVDIGTYFDIAPQNTSAIQYYPFLRGINGRYIANYDDNRKLKDITVINGEPDRNPNDSYQKTLSEVNAVYGPATSTINDNQGNKISRFQTTRLAITVYERKPVNGMVGSPIVTIITLK